MTSSKSTKRALISSALAILMCVAMLIGTTFAWFTDTASTGVNKIVSGNLKVDIIGADSEDHVEKLNFTKAATTDEEAGAEILWEPGCRYLTEGFRIANKGNLALKWKAEINKDNIVDGKVVDTAKDGVSLLDVIDFYVVTSTDADADAIAIEDFVGNLKAGIASSEVYYIKGVMQTTAGNDYQDLTLDGITITVYATQDTVENDSYDNNYDAKAEYAVSVKDQAGLDAALKSDGATKITIESGADVAITGADYAGKNPGTTIENRGTLTVTGATIYSTDTAAQGRAAITNYGTLTVEDSTLGSTQSRGNAIRNYGTATVKNSNLTCCDNYLNGGFAYVFATSDGVLTIEDCTYEGGANGVFAADGGEIIINSGSYKLTGAKSFHMFYMEEGKITVNGGTFEKSGNTRAFANLDGTGELAEHLIINGGTFTFNGAAWTLN